MKTSSYDEFLADLFLRSAQNDGLVRGAAIERYRGAANEGRKTSVAECVNPAVSPGSTAEPAPAAESRPCWGLSSFLPEPGAGDAD